MAPCRPQPVRAPQQILPPKPTQNPGRSQNRNPNLPVRRDSRRIKPSIKNHRRGSTSDLPRRQRHLPSKVGKIRNRSGQRRNRQQRHLPSKVGEIRNRSGQRRSRRRRRRSRPGPRRRKPLRPSKLHNPLRRFGPIRLRPAQPPSEQTRPVAPSIHRVCNHVSRGNRIPGDGVASSPSPVSTKP
jgi:hypothetical protein